MNIYDIDDCFLEYSGNPDKNQEFKENLDEVYDLIEHFMLRIVRLSDCEQKIYDIVLACDKKGKIEKKDMDVINSLIPGYNKWYEKETKKFSSQVIWRKFDSTVDKFNNKYSNVVMEYKKKFMQRQYENIEIINNLVTPWVKDSKNNKKLDYLYDRIGELDKSYRDSIFRVYNQFNKALVCEANGTLRDIVYISKKLDIAKEKSLSYKFINAVFKK